MDPPSTSNVSTNIYVSLDVRIDDAVFEGAEDDSIPFTESIPANIYFCWSEATT
jgi:hypothetical protein